jgi:hypothetical protein
MLLAQLSFLLLAKASNGVVHKRVDHAGHWSKMK